MQVIDAKQAFLSWNEKSFENFISKLPPEQQSALKILPLLFQTNDRLLPGYNGADTPAGIYGYLPDSSIIKEVRKLHDKFRYEQTRALKNSIIESIYLQVDALNNELMLWVVHVEKLKPERFNELENKITKIKSWLNSRGLDVSSKLLTAKRLAKKSKPAAIFLDDFYHESFLLAGKYPVWWLVPPEKEQTYDEFVNHIKAVRFVNAEEFIDLGGLSGLKADDFLKMSTQYSKNIFKAPEYNFLKLLLLKQKQDAWPGVDGLSWRLKREIYSNIDNWKDFFSHSMVFHAAQDYIESCRHNKAVKNKPAISYSRLFGLLSQDKNSVSSDVLIELSLDFDFGLRKPDVAEYINLNQNLFLAIKNVFLLLLDDYVARLKIKSDKSELLEFSRNMSYFLSQEHGCVPVYIVRNRSDYVLGKILLRHNIEGEAFDFWSLIVEKDEGEEKVLSKFDNLLTLILWLWLNRLVDRSTQVSIKCPKFLIKQVEAHHVLEILIQNINPDAISNTSSLVFKKPDKPLRSMLFFNMVVDDLKRNNAETSSRDVDPLAFGDVGKNLFTSCEQIVINTWGDVQIRSYTGNNGVLQCLCDWMNQAPLTRALMPQELKCFGYASGESTFLAQRIDQIYEELIQFFYYQKNIDGCFIVRIGNDYYALYADKNVLVQSKVGYKLALYSYFEQPNKKFKPFALERLALPYVPLREIFQRNKKDVVQIFFQLSGRVCEAWVLDEKGSLCHMEHDVFDRGSYITHWLFVMRNIRNRLKKINYQDRELPSIEVYEISRNDLGVVEFYPASAEQLGKNKNFMNVQVVVAGDATGEKISLVCEGEHFDFDVYGGGVIAECVRYISAQFMRKGVVPVYVTDIDAPLRIYNVEDRENIQTTHFLKYIRNIETTLNKLL